MKIALLLDGINPNVQAQWLATLTELMPDETILLSACIDERSALEVDVAVVANPAVSELKRFPNLVWVHSIWAGIEKIVNPTNPLKLVRLVDPKLAKTMAESVLAWTLYLQRDMPFYHTQQSNKVWQPRQVKHAKNIRVSVLGAGELGMAALTILGKLDYSLSCWSRSTKALTTVQQFKGVAGLKAMLKQTDILIGLLPLTQDTHHLLNKELLGLLPQGASIINFARGGIIDINALITQLNIGHLSHAVLDVFDEEPLPKHSPLWDHPSITVLPHISAPTDIHSAAIIVATNIQQYRQTQLIPACVDLARGY